MSVFPSLVVSLCRLDKDVLTIGLLSGKIQILQFKQESCTQMDVYIVLESYAIYSVAGAGSQAGDADSSRVPGLTPGLQGSVNVHRGAVLLVPQ